MGSQRGISTASEKTSYATPAPTVSVVDTSLEIGGVEVAYASAVTMRSPFRSCSTPQQPQYQPPEAGFRAVVVRSGEAEPGLLTCHGALGVRFCNTRRAGGHAP